MIHTSMCLLNCLKYSGKVDKCQEKVKEGITGFYLTYTPIYGILFFAWFTCKTCDDKSIPIAIRELLYNNVVSI